MGEGRHEKLESTNVHLPGSLEILRDGSPMRRCPGQHLGFRPVASSKTWERNDPPKERREDPIALGTISVHPLSAGVRPAQLGLESGYPRPHISLPSAGSPVDTHSGSRGTVLHFPSCRSFVWCQEPITMRCGGFHILRAGFDNVFAGSWQHHTPRLKARCTD